MSSLLRLPQRRSRRVLTITTVDGRTVDARGRVAAYAAAEWAGFWRMIIEYGVRRYGALRRVGASADAIGKTLILTAQATELAGLALQVAGQLYIDNRMAVAEMPASMRDNPLNVELELQADGTRRVVRTYQRPADWIDAGRRLLEDSKRFLERLPAPQGGPPIVNLSHDDSMDALPPVALAITVVGVVAGAIAVTAIVYTSIQSALDVFALNARAFDEELRIGAAAFDARLEACQQLPPAEREACIQRAADAAIENVRAAAAEHDRSRQLLGVAGAAALAAGFYFASRT